jgi:hypothetical protein
MAQELLRYQPIADGCEGWHAQIAELIAITKEDPALGGAQGAGGAQAPLSNRHFKQLSREITAAQPSINSPRLRWSTNKIGFDEEDHLISTRAIGRIPLLCTLTINNITINRWRSGPQHHLCRIL